MPYTLLLSVLIPIISLLSCASKPAPIVQWSQTFGGESVDQGRSVQQTTDGGYIVCGITESYGAGGQDIWLIKTDAEGNKLWDRTFGGGKKDIGMSVQQTTDGGYIVCGSTDSYGTGGEDIWLIKTDADGNKLWDNTFGGNGFNAGRSVQQTGDGGYIICGYTDPDVAGKGHAWLIKVDADGNKLWDKTFGGEVTTIATSVQQTTDGGYIICGMAGSYGTDKTEAYLIKTDAAGNQLWDETFVDNDIAVGNSVRQSTDGGYIVCGTASSNKTGAAEVLLIKTDGAGKKLWDRTYGGKGIDSGNSVQQTTDGGYVICGTTTSHETNKPIEVSLIKTDAKGNKLWDKTFGDEGVAQGESVQQTKDGGYIACGTVSSEGSKHILLLKIAPEQ
jgi:predicted secreted protein